MQHRSPFIRPDWHLSLSQEPVRRPLVSRSDGQLVSERNAGTMDARTVERLPGTVVMPAFVNAHTHLDMSSFESPLGRQGMKLTDWLVQVIRFRSGVTSGLPGETGESVREAFQACRRFGTSLIGNIAGKPWQATDPDPGQPAIIDYFEQLGADPNQAVIRNSLLKRCLDQTGRIPAKNRRTGISPHAPYSMSVELFDLTIEMAKARELPVAMHLAESVEERQFLDQKSGPFLDVLGEAGIDPVKTAFPAIRYCLQRLAECVSAVVVHGNHLTDSEMDLIAEHSSRVSVVWCPRTHQWFGHDPWPLTKMMQRGICVAIGTDSRASSPDLDVLAELQAVANSMPELDPRTILRMGTLNGFQAIGEQATASMPGHIPQIMLHYADEIRDDPESAVLCMIPLERTLLVGTNAQTGP